MPGAAWLVLIAAAILEVTGDAVIRKGLRGGGLALIALGFCLLGCYGLIVNRIPWNFSRLLGVYVVFFFVVAQLLSWIVFHQRPGTNVLIGGAFIVAGGIIISYP